MELEVKTGKPVISPLNAKNGIMLKGKDDSTKKDENKERGSRSKANLKK